MVHDDRERIPEADVVRHFDNRYQAHCRELRKAYDLAKQIKERSDSKFNGLQGLIEFEALARRVLDQQQDLHDSHDPIQAQLAEHVRDVYNEWNNLGVLDLAAVGRSQDARARYSFIGRQSTHAESQAYLDSLVDKQWGQVGISPFASASDLHSLFFQLMGETVTLLKSWERFGERQLTKYAELVDIAYAPYRIRMDPPGDATKAMDLISAVQRIREAFDGGVITNTTLTETVGERGIVQSIRRNGLSKPYDPLKDLWFGNLKKKDSHDMLRFLFGVPIETPIEHLIAPLEFISGVYAEGISIEAPARIDPSSSKELVVVMYRTKPLIHHDGIHVSPEDRGFVIRLGMPLSNTTGYAIGIDPLKKAWLDYKTEHWAGQERQ
ncbi:hypothetical protein HYS47_01895 [Candidatus Woesearchaeota archaeon]|nr:hypothetical protein [Candidatus Woesearchaeota archaeon]